MSRRGPKTMLKLDSGTYHLIGIGGIGVSAVARLLLARGKTVQGSDVRESQLTRRLRDLGVRVQIGHDASLLEGVDVVVVSTAIPETNPEWVAAREQGLPVVHRSEVLGALMAQRRSIAVVGTHGKGTVSGAIAWLLDSAGWEPGYVIGGLLENFGDNARDGDRWIVAEVDESDGSLVNTKPEVAVLNNLELDHLNYYPDWPALESALVGFFEANERLELAVFNADDPGARRIMERIAHLAEGEKPIRIVSFGFEAADPDLRGGALQTSKMSARFEVFEQEAGRSMRLGEVATSLPGAYNASNLLGALTTCHTLGVAFDDLAKALPAYLGLENRFTLVEAAGVEVVKDYISHPTGIRRVLQAARSQAIGEVVAVFKPYRFTMIHYLQDDYAVAFEQADRVVVTELYTAGEVPIPGVDTDMLCKRIRERCDVVEYVHELSEIAKHLEKTVDGPATVIFFGGDDLFQVADGYIEARNNAARLGPAAV